jgi:hypothetical protein
MDKGSDLPTSEHSAMSTLVESGTFIPAYLAINVADFPTISGFIPEFFWMALANFCFSSLFTK